MLADLGLIYIDFMWNDTTDITGVEIDKLVENIMCRFFVAVFNDKSKN
ncbi:hypothetical protein Hanom_Chr02g00111311 [Helianthus anomalus]